MFISWPPKERRTLDPLWEILTYGRQLNNRGSILGVKKRTTMISTWDIWEEETVDPIETGVFRTLTVTFCRLGFSVKGESRVRWKTISLDLGFPGVSGRSWWRLIMTIRPYHWSRRGSPVWPPTEGLSKLLVEGTVEVPGNPVCVGWSDVDTRRGPVVETPSRFGPGVRCKKVGRPVMTWDQGRVSGEGGYHPRKMSDQHRTR